MRAHASGACEARRVSRDRRVTTGMVFGFAAGVALSTGGVALRFVEEASGWQVLFYRALAFSLLMTVVMGLRYRGGVVAATRAVGASGVAVAVLLSGGAIAYVFAILHTSVANVVVLLSASPLVTALLARIVLGERADLPTWAAMLVVVFGITVMFADGLQGGGLVGLLIAMCAVLTFASMLTVLRRTRGRDMLPATALSGPITAAIALCMAPSLAVSAHDLAIGAFLGTVQFGLGFILITLATRRIPAAQVALLTLSEVVLAPLWVWLAVAERPTMLGFVGGAIVLFAVLGQALWALWGRSSGPGIAS